MSYQEIFPEVIETSLVKQPSTPQIKIKNPLAKNIFVNSIQLSFDAYFSEKGVIMIKINTNIILAPKKAGTFARLKSFSVPMKNLEFLRQKNIEIFAWNGKDTDEIKVSADIHISEDSVFQIPIDQALPDEDFRNRISDNQVISAIQNRDNSTENILIDMKGYKKMILYMIGKIPLVTVVFSEWQAEALIIDQNLLVKTVGEGIVAGQDTEFRVDFGSIAIRPAAVKWEAFAASSPTVEIELSTSDTDSGYVVKTTNQHGIGASQDFTTLVASHSFRFMKCIIRHISGLSLISSIYEAYNPDHLGGTVAVSFEVKEKSQGVFLEYISSGSLGTVTTGNDIVKQLGDVLESSGTDRFNVILPSTQTDFRMKIIATGKIRMGVSIFLG